MENKVVQLKQPGQVPIDLSKMPLKKCECGCENFSYVVKVYMISAIVSPTGQELSAQVADLICMDCQKPLVLKEGDKKPE